MRRILAITAASAMILGLCACGSVGADEARNDLFEHLEATENTPAPENPEPEEETEPEPEGGTEDRKSVV